MKKIKKKRNLGIVILVFLFLILSFVSYDVSFSKVNVVTTLEPENNNYVSDEEIWAFLDSLEEVEIIVDEEIEIEIAEPDDEEDPDKEIKANEANKGKSKETTAEKAVELYETNETSLGIDVSTWQGDIDWKKVKASGINFAMIRVGFRRMDSGTIAMDNQFLDNIKGAIANNINVGIYFFSMAKNSSEALEEAKWVVNAIKDYDITYPVAIDTEIFNKHRLTGVSYSTLTNNALVFCEYIKKAGYTPMIYSYANAFTNYFDTAKFSGQRIWLAQFNDTVTYKGNYHMWQYTSSGSVPGISGRVDMDVAYFSVTNDVTKSSTVNGITNTGNLSAVLFKDMNMDTTLTKTVTLRSSPYTSLPNKAGTLDKETEITVIGMADDFIKIKYNGNVFYINDTDCFAMNLDEIVFDDVDLSVMVNKDVILLFKPYNFLNNNEYMTIKSGDTLKIVGINSNYVKVYLDGATYYINDVDFYTVLNDNIYNSSS